MIKTIKIPVLINGNFFPNEMQIAFLPGIPILESPFFTARQNKNLFFKIKLNFKNKSLKLPNKKIFITFKDPNLIPKDYQFLEVSILHALMCLSGVDIDTGMIGSVNLTNQISFSSKLLKQIRNSISCFDYSEKVTIPNFDLHPPVFKSKLPRTLLLALYIQKVHNCNLLLIGDINRFKFNFYEFLNFFRYFNLTKENFSIINSIEPSQKLFLDSLHLCGNQALDKLNQTEFRSSLASIQSCPCGKLFSSLKCSCGVNYSKTIYKHFLKKILNKFQLILNIENDLLHEKEIVFNEKELLSKSLNQFQSQNILQSLGLIQEGFPDLIIPKRDLKILTGYKKQICL